MSEKQRLKKYAAALAMWSARFNSAEIAGELELDEPTVCRWIWNYREVMRGGERG